MEVQQALSHGHLASTARAAQASVDWFSDDLNPTVSRRETWRATVNFRLG